MTASWPLVVEGDDGIRPAGPQDQCLYCQRRIGDPHKADCVIVGRLVELSVVASLTTGRRMEAVWTSVEPHGWTADNIQFRYNEGSWCADNIFNQREAIVWKDPRGDEWEALEDQSLAMGCLCGVLRIDLKRIVDETPIRKIREKAS